jgi:UDP:flavonoid glycosyltransferase YjiC (YdhE family)
MKILCIPYSHTLSHISRPLLIAKELRNRGHEIVFAGESPKIKFIEREGFVVLPLYEPDPDRLFGNIRRGKLRFVDDAEIERMIEADLSIYDEIKPDFVLTDGRFTAPISTHIAGLRHAAIVNVSSTEYRALPYVP